MAQKKFLLIFLIAFVLIGATGCGLTGNKVSPVSVSKQLETSHEATIWRANFDLKLKYEVKAMALAGYVDNDLQAMATFVVDEATGKLEITAPGIINIKISDSIADCDYTSTMGSNVMIPVTTINGTLSDGKIVFDKNFVVPQFKEGTEATCRIPNNPDYTFSDAKASLIDLIGQHAFPVSVDLEDGATAPVAGTFDFSGRQAVISGTVTIHEQNKAGEI